MVNKSLYIGKKQFNYTVIDIVRRDGRRRDELKCLCNCGKTFYLYPYMFGKEMYKSCGCYKAKKINKFNRSHGGSKNPLYQEYLSMVQRCYRKEHKAYASYGGRGITVCQEWLDAPQAFYDWVESVGGRPKGYTLDRVDNSKGYSPDNCKFVSIHDQSRNKRSNIKLTHNGVTKCLTDWALEYGVNNETARQRYHKGYTFEEIFSKENLPNSGRFKAKHL